MSITIKYFGAIAEQTGVKEEVMHEFADFSEVRLLIDHCISKYQLSSVESIQVAVNQELQKVGVIKDGDEVAFLPPFAGG